MLVELMEGVEDLPGAVLHEGLSWEWESIADYLDALDRRRYDIDLAAQVCHGPVRVYVMGQRGADREVAPRTRSPRWVASRPRASVPVRSASPRPAR